MIEYGKTIRIGKYKIIPTEKNRIKTLKDGSEIHRNRMGKYFQLFPDGNKRLRTLGEVESLIFFNSERKRINKSTGKNLTIRDQDILEFYEMLSDKSGVRFSTLIKRVLRAYMLDHALKKEIEEKKKILGQ